MNGLAAFFDQIAGGQHEAVTIPRGSRQKHENSPDAMSLCDCHCDCSNECSGECDCDCDCDCDCETR